MAHDFAKHRSAETNTAQRKKPGRAATKKTDSGDGSHWSWFLTGLISGLFVAFIAYLGVIRPGLVTQVSNNAVSPDESTQQPPAQGLARFDFYEYLPAAEVQVDVVPVEIAPPAGTDDDIYLLQAGSFQARIDAETRRADIILMNLDANVVPGIVSGKTWHRVQVGPFTGRRATESARDTLASNNIDSIPLLMKQGAQ
ncbi:MAG: SPOR domain-containing protein [Pseudohongiellaceae bacterium]